MESIFDDHVGSVSKDITLENISEPATDTSSKPNAYVDYMKVQRLPEGIKSRLIKLVEIMGHKDSTLKIDKIDYKIAVELFAMIPEYVSAIDTGKLTRMPSTANTNLVSGIMQKNYPVLETEVLNELYSYYNELYQIYFNSKKDIVYTISTLALFSETIKPKVDKVRDGLFLVMVGRDTININLCDLDNLSKTKLHLIDCEKLKQQLPGLVEKLVSGSLLNLLNIVNTDQGDNAKVYSYSSINLIDVMSICSTIVTDGKNKRYLDKFFDFERTYEFLNSKVNNPSVKTPAYLLENAYRTYNSTVDLLLAFNQLKANIDSNDSILETIDNLLELLGSI